MRGGEDTHRLGGCAYPPKWIQNRAEKYVFYNSLLFGVGWLELSWNKVIEFRAAIEIDDQPFGSFAPIRLRLHAVITPFPWLTAP